MQSTVFKNGFKDGIPVGASFFITFISAGALTKISGFNLIEAVTMTVVIFAAPAQYTLAAMVTQGAVIWSILTTVLVINSRFFVMAASLARSFKNVGIGKVMIAAPMLSASTFSVTYASENEQDSDLFYYYLGVCAASYPVSIIATGIGYVLLERLPKVFLLTAPLLLPLYFSILLAKEWPKLRPLCIALVSFILVPVFKSQFQNASLPIVSIAVGLCAALMEKKI